MTDLGAGFANSALDAQSCFRALLDGMAHPGRLCRVTTQLVPPPPLARATAAVVLTLIDAATSLWLDPAFAAASPWIAFHTGAATLGATSAAFVVAARLPDLATLATGTDEAPETAATLIMQVQALDGGTAFTLAGPGIRATETLRVRGLPLDFAAIWARNHAQFPRGVDLLLCAGDTVAAVPRSVSVVAA